MFFKRNAPTIVDYDKTKSELLRLGWLSKIYNVEDNKSVYDITSLGYQYYFAICMNTGYTQMFGGPALQEGQMTAHINEDIDLIDEGYIIDVIDSAKLTPKAAEYLYVLTDLHGKEITVKKQNTKETKNGAMNKFGKYSDMFMRGMQKVSKVAQEYDKNSTASTRNAWSKEEKSSSRKRKHKISKEKRDKLHEHGLYLLDISDKNWLVSNQSCKSDWVVIADQDNPDKICFLFKHKTDIDKLIIMLQELDRGMEEGK